MNKNVAFRIIAGLILLAAIAGIALFAYQEGAMYRTAANIQLPAAGNIPFFPYLRHPFFNIFRVLFAFFLLILAFSAMRHLIWGPHWYWRHTHHGPRGERGRWGDGIPPMFAEWHHRAHAAPGWDRSPVGDKAPDESNQ